LASQLRAGLGVPDACHTKGRRVEDLLGGDGRRMDDVNTRRRCEAVVARAERADAYADEAARMRANENWRQGGHTPRPGRVGNVDSWATGR
jgi:hypothetical protein